MESTQDSVTHYQEIIQWSHFDRVIQYFLNRTIHVTQKQKSSRDQTRLFKFIFNHNPTQISKVKRETMLISSLSNPDDTNLDIDPETSVPTSPILDSPHSIIATNNTNPFDDVFEEDNHFLRHLVTGQHDAQTPSTTENSRPTVNAHSGNPQTSSPESWEAQSSHVDASLARESRPRPYYSHTGEISDVPRLQATHSNAGYRDGIADAKSRFVQDGFDEGFALSAEIGRRVGWILGVLDGVVTGLEKAVTGPGTGSMSRTGSKPYEYSDKTLGKLPESMESLKVEEGPGPSGNVSDTPPPDYNVELNRQISVALNLLEEARKELAMEKIFGEEYMHPDALWKYPVTVEREAQGEQGIPAESSLTTRAENEESLVSFADVAAAHPLVIKWGKCVKSLEQDIKVDFAAITKRLDSNADIAEQEA